MVQKATAEADKYLFDSCMSKQGQDLAGGSQFASQEYFCWYAGTAVLDVICCGWLSFAIHMIPFPPFCTFLGL